MSSVYQTLDGQTETTLAMSNHRNELEPARVRRIEGVDLIGLLAKSHAEPETKSTEVR